MYHPEKEGRISQPLANITHVLSPLSEELSLILSHQ